jgi:phosphohistidine phosphatase
MKTLILVRHAKSDWSMDNQKDIDRPLNPRGYTDAHRMGKMLAEEFGKPDSIIASPAVRTMTTALIFCDEFNFPKSKIKIDATLYESSTADYLKCIRDIDHEINSAMIIGHNPVLSDLCMSLTRSIIELPTCAIVIFEFSGEKWEDFSKQKIQLKEVKTPKSGEM